MSALDNLPRGLPKDDKGGSPPISRWEDPAFLADKFNYTAGHMFLGKHADRMIGVADDRHHMLIAGSRAGKGRSVIINNLLHYHGSALVIDPKGENANVTAMRRAEMGQSVHILDPFGRIEPHCERFRASFNPLSILRADSSTLTDDAILIADALVIPSGGDSHWDDSAKNFIVGLILHVVTWPAYVNTRDLVTVYELLSNGTDYADKDGMDGLEAEMSANEAADGAVQSAGAAFFEKAEAELGGVLSSARKHLSFLGSEAMKKVVCDPSIDLGDMKRHGTTIYLCLPAGRMGANNRWLRLFVNLAIEALESTKGEQGVSPVVLFLDEFPVLGHMRQIEDAAGQIAGFGVKLFVIIQDLSQLKALYRDRWETFVGNAGVVQCFSNTETTTTEWISKKLGNSLVTVTQSNFTSRTQSAQTGDLGKRSHDELHPLLTPDEVAYHFAREQGRQIVFINGQKPVALERVNYDQHEFFKPHAWTPDNA